MCLPAKPKGSDLPVWGAFSKSKSSQQRTFGGPFRQHGLPGFERQFDYFQWRRTKESTERTDTSPQKLAFVNAILSRLKYCNFFVAVTARAKFNKLIY